MVCKDKAQVNCHAILHRFSILQQLVVGGGIADADDPLIYFKVWLIGAVL